MDRLQFKKPIELIEQYQKHWPIEINRPSNQGSLIGKANNNSVPSNHEQLLGKAESARKQITENNDLVSPTTLAKAETNWKAIDQMITITANITDGIEWDSESARGLDQSLKIWNRSGAWSQSRRPDIQEIDVER